jgi:hypothetical protein
MSPKQPGSFLTQSRFYSPTFNSAIFDGPFRIYFAQQQEALALKVYFKIQENLKDFYQTAKSQFKRHGRNIFVMLYPTKETFETCFSAADLDVSVMMDHLGDDPVVGVRGPIADQDFNEIFFEIIAVIQTLENPAHFRAELPAEVF